MYGQYSALKKSHIGMKNVFTACTLLAINLTMQCFTIDSVTVYYATLRWWIMDRVSH